MQEVLKMLSIFSICATAGWVLEFIYRLIRWRKVINPGFLMGFALPIYGVGGVVLYLSSKLFIDINGLMKIIYIFIFTSIVMTLIEYIAGYICIKYYKIRLWDYSKLFCNYKGIICLGFTLAWGAISSVYIILLQKYILILSNIIINNKLAIIFLGIYYVIFILDLLGSLNILNRIRKIMNELKAVKSIKLIFDDVLKTVDRKGVLRKVWGFIEPMSLVEKYIFSNMERGSKKDEK